jgi:hypothetical protein
VRLSPASLLEVFAAAYGPGLDTARASTALNVLLEDLSAPRADDEIRKRRLTVKSRPFFARYERETGVTKAEITAAPVTGGGAGSGSPSDPLTPHRDAFASMLIESKAPRFSLHEVAIIVGRNRAAVRRAHARHEARQKAAAMTVSEKRSEAHG